MGSIRPDTGRGVSNRRGHGIFAALEHEKQNQCDEDGGRDAGCDHGPDKITYGSRCLAFRNRRSVRLNGRTSGPAGELNCSACLHGWRSVSRENWVDDARPRKDGPPPVHSTAAFSGVPQSGAEWDFAGLPKALGTVPDPRKRRGRMYGLVFVLAASLIAVLAGASNFRQVADHVADLPQSLLSQLGARWCYSG